MKKKITLGLCTSESTLCLGLSRVVYSLSASRLVFFLRVPPLTRLVPRFFGVRVVLLVGGGGGKRGPVCAVACFVRWFVVYA